MRAHLQIILVAAFIDIVYTDCQLNLDEYLQPDDVERDTYLNPTVGGKICARDCEKDPEPKICYYQWTVENYVTLGDACGNCTTVEEDCYKEQCIPADGFERGILSINRKYPAPAIQVCLGDRIIVDVKNNMAARTTAIHWHGVFQYGSQYMDGVPMVTQCAIREATTFRYDFMAENEGTHFYHSHDGLQKLDGIEGNLVIRTNKSADPNGLLYDYDIPEHILFVSDWLHLDADQHFPGLLGKNSGQDADAYLINGYGRTKIDSQPTKTPYAKIKVQSQNRYRMRIVGGLCTVCAAQISIEGHKMYVIATDGNPVAPTRVDVLVIYSGERYDIILEAKQTPGSYWIHVKGLTTCTPGRVYQLGILQYEDAGTQGKQLSPDPGYEGFQLTNPRILNPENGTCSTGSGSICTTQLLNSYPVPNNIVSKKTDYNFLLTFGFQSFPSSGFFEPNVYERYFVSPDLDLLSSVMNNISFISPPAPLLSQTKDVPSSIVCPNNDEGVPACPDGKSYCECAHVISVPLGAIVQILLSDETPRSDLNHPFHLHGHAFYVMYEAQYLPNETYRDVFDRMKNTVMLQSPAPALRDSIAVPSKGYAIIKFKANNPGYWFFHCHFMYHLATGMAVVVKVGEESDMGKPPANFPTCNNFMNTLYGTCS